MPQLRLHNTLTRRTEPFVAGAAQPHGAGAVSFYSCGPTVYDDAHIGNFRSFLNADILRRTLELVGYRVKHVMNITDVGHMTDDEDADGAGEDKMAVAGRRIAEAKKAGKLPEGTKVDPSDPYAIAEFYAQRFLEDARTLGLKVALEEEARVARVGGASGAAGGGRADAGGVRESLMPRPSQCIPQMLEMIGTLIKRGNAYVASDGVVYFDVRSFPAYGRLSGNTLDQLKEGAGERINAQNQAVKKHPADFMLWKPDPKHLMRWPSPWGEGYPGWHIECSAMAAMLLGTEIDLHSGGEDNIFPHHECELAQSCCASGHPTFARTWFHTRYLQVEGAKMSKSKGNFFTARSLFAKGVTPAALRLEIVRTHYRSQSNFTLQGLQDCQRMIDRWSRAHAQLVQRVKGAKLPPPDETRAAGPFELALAEFTEAMCDDLNLARGLGAINEAVGASAEVHAAADAQRELTSLLAIDGVLGVLGRNTPVAGAAPEEDPEFVAKIDALLARRAAARSAKDWAESDRVRDELTQLGVTVKDGAKGQTWARV